MSESKKVELWNYGIKSMGNVLNTKQGGKQTCAEKPQKKAYHRLQSVKAKFL